MSFIQHKTVTLRLLACLIAGGLMPLAFAPYDYYPVSWFAPAVLFFIWLKSTPGNAFVYGYVFGFGMFGTGVNWLHISINLFGGVNFAGAIIITYVLVAFISLYPALVGYLTQKYFQKSNFCKLLLVIPALWILSEWFRSWIFTGFPWLNLGYSQIDLPLAGLAPITGVYGIGWMVCITAAVLAYVFNTRLKKGIIAVIILSCAWSGSYYLGSIKWTENSGRFLSVTLIQGAIPQEQKWSKENKEYTRDLYLSLSAPHWGNDLIIWPETAIPALYHQADFLIDPLNSLVNQHQTEILTGIPFRDEESGKYFNSIITLGKSGDIYHKRHLVPFGEYLPLRPLLLPMLNFLKIPMSDFSAGRNKPVVSAAGENIGVSICYEDTFGEEIIDAFPEATLLVNISNDAWFGDSLAPHQHLQMARMRALETGRYLLRATNTGISAIINEQGEIISQSPQFEPHALTGKAITFTGETPYVKYGNIPIILLAFLLVGLLLLARKNQVQH